MTFKLLYNDAVAMTGGQTIEGRLVVPALTRLLALEGVRRVVVTTPEPEKYRGIRLDPRASVRHRDGLNAAERELAQVEGVTVLIHDDRCAAEERRLRKRGRLPAPRAKVVVNERVCEGCGDCGDQSSCLSVQPVETEFGRKTRIHQPSCNSDLSCLKGDCPSFLLVEPGRAAGAAAKPGSATARADGFPEPPVELREPEYGAAGGAAGREVLVRMPGIGGTGVVTVSQILQTAAHLDGLHAAGLDQTGLAQKGGPVVSDVRIGKNPITGAVRASGATVDLLIGFDLLGAAAEANLAVCHPERTVAVVNTALVPTAAMVTGRTAVPGGPGDALARIADATRADALTSIDAQALAEELFGDHMPANLLLLGAAYQRGRLPVSAEAIERAVRLNGASVEANLTAFRWGRAAVLDPEAVAAARRADPREEAAGGPTDSLEEAVALRTADLTEYQDARYAERYAQAVGRVEALATERAGAEPGRRIALAFARSLHRLMAYKDEYEVARLHLGQAEQARLRGEFGPDARVSVLLHPPVLRALGRDRKIALGPWARPVLRGLARGRRLRGTPRDPFGHTRIRRVDRELRDSHTALVARLTAGLSGENYETSAARAAHADLVRGYEDVKLAAVRRYRARLVEPGVVTPR
jgi:indolepyruvate ferredoxin oxidoreductase